MSPADGSPVRSTRSIGARLRLSMGTLMVVMAVAGAVGFTALWRAAVRLEGSLSSSFASSASIDDLRAAAIELKLGYTSAAERSAQSELPGLAKRVASAVAKVDAWERSQTDEDAAPRASALRAALVSLREGGDALVNANAAQRWQESAALSQGFERASAGLETLLAEMLGGLRRSMTSDVGSVSREVVRSAGVLLVGLLACLALSVAFTISLQRRIVKPLVELERATSRIVLEGDLSGRLDVEATDDELGRLAASFRTMVEKLREVPVALTASTALLGQAVSQVSKAMAEQSASLQRQAAAMAETQATAQEIRQTSLMASEKAEAVLAEVSRAAEIGRAGTDAVRRSLAGLASIQGSVDAIAQQVGSLDGRVDQIGLITETVNELATQAKVLALNAAIEATRAGEHGRGFGVVAKEMRGLATQSLEATQQVRTILADVSAAANDAMKSTHEGSAKVTEGLGEVRSSGAVLTDLGSLVQGNSNAMRQISAAVTQQAAGIEEIFSAMKDLAAQLSASQRTLADTAHAAEALESASSQVQGVVHRFRLE